jgi:hypothetical protein
VAKSTRGEDWKYLSIPPGKSAAYNQAPRFDRATAHQEELAKRTPRK